MELQWIHTPIALRFISKDDVFGVSGVHLIALDTSKAIVTDFILTFNSADVDEKFRVMVSSKEKSSSSQIDIASPDISQLKYLVDWFPGKVVAKYSLSETLAVHFNYFRQNGFAIIPQDVANTEISILKISLASDTIRQQFRARKTYTPILFCSGPDIREGTSVDVVSSPFNFNNSLLFSDFVSEGSVNYILKLNTNEVLAYCTDTRYMENMLGGVVYLHQKPNSPGLILGNLKKLNGDGDLTIIIPWSIIGTVLGVQSFFSNQAKNLIFLVLVNNIGSLENSKRQIPISPSNSVLPLKVKERYKTSWGSCVLYNENTLITNFHVIKPYVNDPTLVVEVFLGLEAFQLDEEADKVITPAQDVLDLSFIILSPTHSQRLQKTKHIPAFTNSYSYSVGDSVYSQGYGLFFNSAHQDPITSRGIINATLPLPIQTGDIVLNSIIITSASCWNGSSGGGLFSSSNELLGLVCSNAQVFVPSFEGNSNPKTEKISRISFVLPVDIIKFCFENLHTKLIINPQIADLWQLKSFHEDVVLESSKF